MFSRAAIRLSAIIIINDSIIFENNIFDSTKLVIIMDGSDFLWGVKEKMDLVNIENSLFSLGL